MNTITVPKKLIKNDDLITITRREYEEFLSYKLKNLKEVDATPFQKKIINKARQRIAKGKFFTLNEFKSKSNRMKELSK